MRTLGKASYSTRRIQMLLYFISLATLFLLLISPTNAAVAETILEETFLGGLKTMMIGLQVVENHEYEVIIFATGCAIIGAFAVLLDLSLYTVTGQSLFKLQYKENTVVFLFAWAFGSFAVGYLGQAAAIFQVSLLSSLLVGFSWPVVLNSILSKLRDREIAADIDEPIQQTGVEDEED